MAKKKGKSEKTKGKAEEKDASSSSPVQAELATVAPSNQVAPAKQSTDLTSVSCMEVASTPCANIADTFHPEFVDEDDETPELWADLANAPCTDITVESSTDVAESDNGVSELVTQQLRQMFEEGGATATCASAGSFTGTHTMNLNVKAGSVDMNLSTITESNQELLELRTQIDLLQRLLEESGVRLEVANQRIGALEAELMLKNKLLDEKLEQGSWLRSLFGL